MKIIKTLFNQKFKYEIHICADTNDADYVYFTLNLNHDIELYMVYAALNNMDRDGEFNLEKIRKDLKDIEWEEYLEKEFGFDNTNGISEEDLKDFLRESIIYTWYYDEYGNFARLDSFEMFEYEDSRKYNIYIKKG